MFTINPPLSPNSPTYVGHFSPTERHTDKQLERRCYKLMRWHMLDLDERHRLHLHSDPNSNVNTREADFSCWASLCCTAVAGCDFFHSETKSKNTCGGNNVCRLEGRGCTAATAPPLPRTDLQVSTIHWERLAASSWDEATLEVRAGHTHTHTVSTAVQPDVWNSELPAEGNIQGYRTTVRNEQIRKYFIAFLLCARKAEMCLFLCESEIHETCHRRKQEALKHINI